MNYSLRHCVITFALVLFFLGGCDETEPLLTQNEIPSDTTISLERTACFGPCPIYTVTIVADGTVTYNGEKYVRESGVIVSSISEENIRKLIREFEKINYFEYEDDYGYDSVELCQQIATDNPSAITTFTIRERSKRINHYYGCRGFPGEEELTSLENMIDEIVNAAQWIDEQVFDGNHAIPTHPQPA